MLTLYTWPKSFADSHIATIQRNAVRSWLKLEPQPAILVFGDAPGTAEYCAEFGLAHLPEPAESPLETVDGAARIRQLATRAEAASESACYCFINADIILTNSFMSAVEAVSASFHDFLLGASPWELDITEPLAFPPGWELELERLARAGNTLRPAQSADFFVYRRGYLATAPDVVVGRWYVDNAILWHTRRIGAALVDGTSGILTIHQNHHYAHLGRAAQRPGASDGAAWNLSMIGGLKHVYTWRHATHHFSAEGLRRYWAGDLLHWFARLGLDPGAKSGFFVRFWEPLARLTRPVRRVFGLTNPRHGSGSGE